MTKSVLNQHRDDPSAGPWAALLPRDLVEPPGLEGPTAVSSDGSWSGAMAFSCLGVSCRGLFYVLTVHVAFNCNDLVSNSL